MNWDDVQEMIREEGLQDFSEALDEDELNELLDTGSVTTRIGDREFVVSLNVAEVQKEQH